MELREGKSGHLPAIQSVESLNGRKIVLWEKNQGWFFRGRLDFMGKTTVAKEDRSNIGMVQVL